jgi:sugar phosphate isomerase/epimerase
MYKFPIGVMMESFRLPTLQAIEKAAAIGAQGIQMYATKGEHAPENMTAADRKELLNQLKDH